MDAKKFFDVYVHRNWYAKFYGDLTLKVEVNAAGLWITFCEKGGHLKAYCAKELKEGATIFTQVRNAAKSFAEWLKEKEMI